MIHLSAKACISSLFFIFTLPSAIVSLSEPDHTSLSEARDVLSSTAGLTFRDASDNILLTSDVLGGNAKVANDDEFAKKWGDLGPVYGFQWRHFGGEYQWDKSRIEQNPCDNFNPQKPGIDQVANAIDKIKNNPNDRRILVSAWNPTDFAQMALPPCHMMHQLIVRDGKLNLIWTQRSCDMFLGIPYNIASYALLLLLYAKEAGLTPGVLRGELHDAHIYTNHLDQVGEQLKRTPYKLPTVEIPDKNWNGMLNWRAKDGFTLKDYIHHEKLRGAVAR